MGEAYVSNGKDIYISARQFVIVQAHSSATGLDFDTTLEPREAAHMSPGVGILPEASNLGSLYVSKSAPQPDHASRAEGSTAVVSSDSVQGEEENILRLVDVDTSTLSTQKVAHLEWGLKGTIGALSQDGQDYGYTDVMHHQIQRDARAPRDAGLSGGGRSSKVPISSYVNQHQARQRMARQISPRCSQVAVAARQIKLAKRAFEETL